ncbi:DNA repair protein RecN [Hydromonas duriensis]|uniref:DNA repair protein RecN n=1 Tax=Hydromonas duriensis TaxID=1527608 RepID=A0A4R6Y5M1_9BURK|nr:DNA repair protein RecN [Hydromonas duriensis]TDR30592.1 DNA replication and repair protein RecN [Hydromonas duriensis]
MLTRLSLRNFVIVKSLDLDIESGFTVLTGETGAGKSILLDAIGLLLGDRAEANMVAQGADKADVQAEFMSSPTLMAWLEEAELSGDDDLILIRRTIDAQGKSRAFINGISATLAQLRDLGEQLVHIHGQHAHQQLLKNSAQRDLLDEHAQLSDLRDMVYAAFQQWQQAKKQKEAAETDAAELSDKLETLTWQLDGLNALAPQRDEWESLLVEHTRLSHASTLIQGSAAVAHHLIEQDHSVSDQLREQLQSLLSLVRLDERLGEAAEMLDVALINVQEAAQQLNHYAQRADMDESMWAKMDARIGDWYEQARKFRVAPEDLHDHWMQLQAQFQNLQLGLDLEALIAREQVTADEYHKAALALRKARTAASKKLAKEVTASMQALNMTGGQFDIELVEATPAAHGMDNIEFKVAGHAGVKLQALNKVASGGELARISLALSVITSAANPVPTLIFDEVDSGIGGAVAEVVGQLLARLGQARQVLCVTHLPQVAAQGQQHWQVVKQTHDNVTTSHIHVLTSEERIEEIARMLGGVNVSDTTRAHAQEMLSL